MTDGRSGEISVIDVAISCASQTRQGIGPMRFSRRRYGLVLNTLEDKALVIDASNDQLLHEIEVSPEPYQLIFSRAYAYIRGLASPKVSIISLSSLGRGKRPAVHEFDAGQPRHGWCLAAGRRHGAGREDSSVFVVNPVDSTTYFHMEGMNAPMSGALNRGHTSGQHWWWITRSAQSSQGIRLAGDPAWGRVRCGVHLNQPQLTHCFSTTVKANPALSKVRSRPRWIFCGACRAGRRPAGERAFRILRGDGEPWAGIGDVQLRCFLAPHHGCEPGHRGGGAMRCCWS